MADPGWAARPPEANDLLIKGGAGVSTMTANGTAWTVLGASHHAAGAISTVNTAATSAAWLGQGSAASAVNATELNVALHGLAGWVDIKPAVVSAAIGAYELANASMRPAPECNANRDEWANDNAINPLVFGALTPRIISLDMTYFGFYWPNNAAVGATYGATLNGLAASLAVPPPPAGMGASPAAPAVAASAVAEAGAESASSNALHAGTEGASAATQGPASAAKDVGGQVSQLMGPVQQAVSAVPQALQAPMGMLQSPMQSAMGPAQSMFGMFMNPSALGASGAPAAVSAAGTPVNAVSGAVNAAGGGGGALGGGGGGVPASSFTRPVSAFEPGGGGRPVGLRPSGALGVEPAAMRGPVTTTGGGMGGMPIGHAAAAGQRSSDHRAETATVRIVDERT